MRAPESPRPLTVNTGSTRAAPPPQNLGRNPPEKGWLFTRGDSEERQETKARAGPPHVTGESLAAPSPRSRMERAAERDEMRL